MITLMLLAALAQERDNPRPLDRENRAREQEDLRRRADEIRAQLERTDNEDERARLTAEFARLDAQMAGARHPLSVEEFARIEAEMLKYFAERDMDLSDWKEARPEEYR